MRLLARWRREKKIASPRRGSWTMLASSWGHPPPLSKKKLDPPLIVMFQYRNLYNNLLSFCERTKRFCAIEEMMINFPFVLSSILSHSNYIAFIMRLPCVQCHHRAKKKSVRHRMCFFRKAARTKTRKKKKQGSPNPVKPPPPPHPCIQP